MFGGEMSVDSLAQGPPQECFVDTQATVSGSEDVIMGEAGEGETAEGASRDTAGEVDVDSPQGGAISGSPPKLINTPPTTLNPRKPRTIRRPRCSEPAPSPASVQRLPGADAMAFRVQLRAPEPEPSWPAAPGVELEDGRHIGGVQAPKGIYKMASASALDGLDRPASARGPPEPLLRPFPRGGVIIGRSRSLPDFMEVEGQGEWQKKSQKSSGNSSPRSAMRDWDEDSPQNIPLMLPSPRDELRSFLAQHQAADDYKAALSERAVLEEAQGRLEMQGTAAAELRALEPDRKRPSTDPGSRSPMRFEEGTTESEHGAAALEMARAFSDWVKF